MKRLMVAVAAALFCISVSAQDAEVLSWHESFVMSSPMSGEYHVSKQIRVNNENGRQAGLLVIFTDPYRVLDSFKGSVSVPGGKEIKIKTGDLYNGAVSENFADDSKVTAYSPNATYPYTVTYDYVIKYRKGIVSFPVFCPVDIYDESIVESDFTLTVPAGTEIMIDSNLECKKGSTGGNDTYYWKADNFEAVTDEEFMPSLSSLIPRVHAAPVNFAYAGVSGSQKSWEDVGGWIASLSNGTLDLDEEAKAEIRDLVADCDSDIAKIKKLYKYLRDKTRYVSIQLGIGGYKPMPASKVHKGGFGDCKALSNYMKALLDAVGIESIYTVLSTDRRRFPEGFSSVGLTNHAMLCVPLQEDTLWVECTNPALPLGFRHDDIAGHSVLTVSGEGSRLVDVPAYPDSLNRFNDEVEIFLAPDGSASLKTARFLKLDSAMEYLSFADARPDVQMRRMTSGYGINVNGFKTERITDNFDSYDGPGFVPEMQIRCSMSTDSYGRLSSGRLFVPVNPSSLSMKAQRSERKYDIHIGGTATAWDKVIIHLPDGFHVESMPASAEYRCDWAVFTTEYKLEGQTFTAVQTLKFLEGDYPKEKYPEFRAFVKSLNREGSAALVLVKDN